MDRSVVDLLLCIPPYFIVHNLKSMSHTQKSKLLLHSVLIIIFKCKPFSILKRIIHQVLLSLTSCVILGKLFHF